MAQGRHSFVRFFYQQIDNATLPPNEMLEALNNYKIHVTESEFEELTAAVKIKCAEQIQEDQQYSLPVMINQFLQSFFPEQMANGPPTFAQHFAQQLEEGANDPETMWKLLDENYYESRVSVEDYVQLKADVKIKCREKIHERIQLSLPNLYTQFFKFLRLRFRNNRLATL